MGLMVRDLGRLEYGRALAAQEALLELRIADRVADHLLLVEHEAVYTLGRGADAADLREADRLLAVPVFRVGRGGGVTFHGPGQLVAYPIIKLTRGERDIHGYVRRLEEVIIAACGSLGVVAERHAGSTGVWAGDGKIASIGVGVRRWVTYHGLAVNVCTNLSFFDSVVACRTPALKVTSLTKLLSPAPSMEDVAVSLTQKFSEVFRRPIVGRIAA